jgi:hypothetical protein
VRLCRCALLAAILAAVAVQAQQAPVPKPPILLHSSPDIWFSPRSSGPYATDFYNLFGATGTQWPTVKGRVKAFEISIQLETTGDTNALSPVIKGLAANQIGLGLDLLALTGSNGCGAGVEGYADATQAATVAARFKGLGATPLYYVMDEPLWYGHFYSGVNACASTTATLMSDIAAKVNNVRKVFPSVLVGETEPVSAVMQSDPTNMDRPNLASWFDAFKAATGQSLSFFRLDMDWSANWQPWILPLAKLLGEKGIPFQVIYNGLSNDSSAAAWANHAIANAATFEAIAVPDVAMFQSWNTYPTYDLPETDPTAFTGVIKTYLH